MMTGVNQLFVDTNILIFATNTASPWHATAYAALQTARREGVELIISPQIIREYLVTATRPGTFPASQPRLAILTNIHIFQTDFRLVEETAQVSARLVKLVSQIEVGGKQIHDANIVATMLAHGLTHLLTHNTADFTRYTHLITLLSLDLTAT